MSPNDIRITIAKEMGWGGCTDTKCFWRKAQHLHKNGVVGFPESYSTSRYPNYPESLDDCVEFEKTLGELDWFPYFQQIEGVTGDTNRHTDMKHTFDMITATPLQRCEAFLRLRNKWID